MEETNRPMTVEALEGGQDFAVVRGPGGETYFAPAVRSRAWGRLSRDAHGLVASVQRLAIERANLDDQITAHVGFLREEGVSWDVIATCIGMTGHGARLRYGAPRDGDDE
jgi:hypothetical protein